MVVVEGEAGGGEGVGGEIGREGTLTTQLACTSIMSAHPEPTFECLELWQRQFSPNAAVAGWSLHGSQPSTRRRPGIFCRPRSRWFGVLGRRHGLKPTTWALHLAPGVVWHPESDVLASPGTEGLPSKPGGRPRQTPQGLQTPG